MFGKTAVVSLLIVCITALGVISLVRDSLCELGLRSEEVTPARRGCSDGLFMVTFLWRISGEEQRTLGK